MMYTIKVKSLQPGIRVIRSGNPSFNILFHDKPIGVPRVVANYLVKQSKNFRIVDCEDEEFEVESCDNDEYLIELVAIKGIGGPHAS